MNGLVVDASVALAWCFPDEGSEYADAVLVASEGKSILVPGVWSLEVANAILAGERRKRIRQTEILRFVSLLENLTVVQEVQPAREDVGRVLPLAREYGLSAYDAAYLELAVRRGVPLATLDEKLVMAAKAAGVKVVAV